MPTNHSDKIPDKEYLYGRFQRNEDRRQNFLYRLAHKSVDMATEDDMNFNLNKGVGFKELAVISVTILASIYLYLSQKSPEAPTPQPPPAATAPDFKDTDTTLNPHFVD